jgi:hypothetical protein
MRERDSGGPFGDRLVPSGDWPVLFLDKLVTAGMTTKGSEVVAGPAGCAGVLFVDRSVPSGDKAVPFVDKLVTLGRAVSTSEGASDDSGVLFVDRLVPFGDKAVPFVDKLVTIAVRNPSPSGTSQPALVRSSMARTIVRRWQPSRRAMSAGSR